MRYTPRNSDPRDPAVPLFDSLEPVVKGLGLSLVELSFFRTRGGAELRLVVTKPGSGVVGVNDCSRVHHAALPRVELAFPGLDVSLEVSSPGIDRLIKDASEFVHYTGRGVKCYRTDISDWSGGVLVSSGPDHLVLKMRDGELKLMYDIIAKAKLDDSFIARGQDDEEVEN